MRKGYLLGWMLSVLSLGSAYGLQSYYHLEPCSLCILERWVIWGLLAVYSLAYWLNTSTLLNKLAQVCLSLLTVSGLGLCGYQLWLQSLPAQALPRCTAGLEQLMGMYPLWDAVRQVLQNAGDCGQVEFTLLGLSLAAWSLLSFLLFSVLNGYIISKQLSKDNTIISM